MPSSSSSNLLRYGLCAAVAAVELAVLVLAFRPAVSPAYAAFFIERKTDCYVAEDAVPPFPTGMTIDLSDGNIDARCPLLSAGWKETDEGLVKAKADSAELRFHLPGRPSSGLVLTLAGLSQARSDGPQPVDLLVGGETIGTLILTKTGNESRIVIPERLATGPDLLIRLVPGRHRDSADGRPGRPWPRLALGLTALRLDPLATAEAAPPP
jgi:hypothetical protein